MPSRRAFDAAVEAAAPKPFLAIPRSTYVPAFDARGPILERLRDARRIATGHAGSGSVIVHRRRAETPDSSVDSRNGRAGSDGSAAARFDVMPGAVAAVAHVPIRSAEQFIAEVAVLHVACALAVGSGTEPAFRWQDELAAIKAGRPLTPEQLTTIAANFDAPTGGTIPLAGIRWVDDPFLADIRLAYTPATPPHALGRVLALGERIALAIARTTGGM